MGLFTLNTKQEPAQGDVDNEKHVITHKMFIRHKLYQRIRSVFVEGPRGDAKEKVVEDVLNIKRDRLRNLPVLVTPIKEEDAEKKLERLAKRGMLDPQEVDRIEKVLEEDFHPGHK